MRMHKQLYKTKADKRSEIWLKKKSKAYLHFELYDRKKKPKWLSIQRAIEIKYYFVSVLKFLIA